MGWDLRWRVSGCHCLTSCCVVLLAVVVTLSDHIRIQGPSVSQVGHFGRWVEGYIVVGFVVEPRSKAVLKDPVVGSSRGYCRHCWSNRAVGPVDAGAVRGGGGKWLYCMGKVFRLMRASIKVQRHLENMRSSNPLSRLRIPGGGG